ncbi:type IV pilus twitching motility protein PilT [Lacisediminihabitans changchengi]|nr:PilT/PilU family type 4a pilus ATPase [Lacisediminihabitans changchengi]
MNQPYEIPLGDAQAAQRAADEAADALEFRMPPTVYPQSTDGIVAPDIASFPPPPGAVTLNPNQSAAGFPAPAGASFPPPAGAQPFTQPTGEPQFPAPGSFAGPPGTNFSAPTPDYTAGWMPEPTPSFDYGTFDKPVAETFSNSYVEEMFPNIVGEPFASAVAAEPSVPAAAETVPESVPDVAMPQPVILSERRRAAFLAREAAGEKPVDPLVGPPIVEEAVAAEPIRPEPVQPFTAPTAAALNFAAPTGTPAIVPTPIPEPAAAFVAPAIPVLPDVVDQNEGFFDLPMDAESVAFRAKADPELIAALTEVLGLGASDLHVTTNAIPMIRVDGGLRPVDGLSVWNKDKVAAALTSILTDEQKATFDEQLELDLAYTVSANARFRVNVYQQRGAMGAAFRLIPTDIVQLKDLGVPDSVARFATLARGLVLVTGPTGSGKSTTLAALIDLVNRTRADHIVTVEDPIEFMHKNHKSLVNQREVGPDTHSFASALKHVLRQDPDVILIGELRDLETISVALTAAETGHLVFATLHTQDAAQTIDRVIDVFPPHQQGQVRSQLAATLQGVVCQTLVKRASGKGRVVATEILIATPAINNLIREGKTYQIASAMQAGRDHGMHTMDSHLADLANAGTITVKAAMDKAQDAESLKLLIHRAESATDAAANAMATSGIDFGDVYSRKAE